MIAACKGRLSIDQTDYMDFHLSMYYWLLCDQATGAARFEEESDAWAIAIDDWKNDLQATARPSTPLPAPLPRRETSHD